MHIPILEFSRDLVNIRYYIMDIWFPWFVLICGLILVAPMQSAKLREKFSSLHPFGKSPEVVEGQGWIFIIVGCLWSLQNLLV